MTERSEGMNLEADRPEGVRSHDRLGDTTPELTEEERRAISALKRLARRWPKTLWIYSGGSGAAMVLKTDEAGGMPHDIGGGVDQRRIVAEVPTTMHIDGGDW